MKRIALICMALIALSACEKFSIGDTTDSSEWLSAVPDGTMVCNVSLPGAHDAATATLDKAIIRKFAKTQVLSIADQLMYGVRAFDLRPAVVDGELEICHSEYDTNTSFTECVNAMVEHLDRYPSEFIIVVIRHEEEADGNSDKWAGMMSDFIGSLPENRIMKTFDPEMTVSQMRGRILFLSRNEYRDEPYGAYIKGWTSGTDLEKQKSATIGEGSLWIQDYYDPDGADDKLDAIEAMLRAFSANEKRGVWCINHTSAYVPGIFSAPDYGANAENVNAKTAEWIDSMSGSTGIIVMDFAGADGYKNYKVAGDILLKAVINHNTLLTKVSFR